MRRCDGGCVEVAGKLQGRRRLQVGGAGLGWSIREAAGERAAAGAAEGLQRRGSVLVCTVCTVDSNADIDAWTSNLGSINLGFDHVDHDTQTH